jgi:hypothetical protein
VSAHTQLGRRLMEKGEAAPALVEFQAAIAGGPPNLAEAHTDARGGAPEARPPRRSAPIRFARAQGSTDVRARAGRAARCDWEGLAEGQRTKAEVLERTVAVIRFVLAAALLAGVPAAAHAQGDRYAVLVQGASGEEQYATLHRQWIDSMAKLLVDRFKIDKSHVSLLTEQPRDGEQRSTAENVKAVFAGLAKQLKADDFLFVLLIAMAAARATSEIQSRGTGSQRRRLGGAAQADCRTDGDRRQHEREFSVFEGARRPRPRRHHGDQQQRPAIPHVLSRRLHSRASPPRTPTSTRTAASRCSKRSRTRPRLVAQHYEQENHMVTERAVFDDTGDGVGRDAAGKGPGGTIAGLTYSMRWPCRHLGSGHPADAGTSEGAHRAGRRAAPQTSHHEA